MEYTIDELNDTYNYNKNFDNNEYIHNYWQETTPKDNQQLDNIKNKKKVSFDNILSNMNLVVNNQGELKYMSLKTVPNFLSDDNNIHTLPVSQTQTQTPQSMSYKQTEPLEPELTHSYIYNKYFKDYNQEKKREIKKRVPHTIEEYKQMLIEDKIKEKEHRQLMDKIKPKKMLFTSAPHVNNNIKINASRNKLRMMHFN